MKAVFITLDGLRCEVDLPNDLFGHPIIRRHIMVSPMHHLETKDLKESTPCYREYRLAYFGVYNEVA